MFFVTLLHPAGGFSGVLMTARGKVLFLGLKICGDFFQVKNCISFKNDCNLPKVCDRRGMN